MSQADWDHLKAYKKEIIKGNTIACIWSTDDVLYKASIMGITITPEQAREVLKECETAHDADIGINWDTISFWIHEIYAEKVGI